MDSCSYSKIQSADIENDIGVPLVQKPGQKHSACRERRRRCAKNLCCVLLAVTCLLLGLAAVVGVQVYRSIARGVEEWTVTDPGQPLPVVDVPREELDLFEDQAKLFYDTIQAGRVPPQDLVASIRVANGFAAESDFLRGHSFATMDPNEVRVAVSLPVDGLPGGKGRFLVGTESLNWDPATSSLHARFEDQDSGKLFYDLLFHLEQNKDNQNGEALRLELISGRFLHWDVPQDFIDEHNNLLEDIYHCDHHDEDCKQTRKLLDGLSEVSLEKDRVVVRAKQEASHGHRGLLVDVEQSQNSNGSDWKFRLARRLVGI